MVLYKAIGDYSKLYIHKKGIPFMKKQLKASTTIQLHIDTKNKLEKLKFHSRESFNSVVERLVENNLDESPLSSKTLKNIEASLKDIKAGRVVSHKDVKKRLGI